jgi:hypothetical protein
MDKRETDIFSRYSRDGYLLVEFLSKEKALAQRENFR